MEIRFDDHKACPDSDIAEVTESGIRLSGGQFIDFAQCATHFHDLHGGSGRCVGERNIAERTICFYTAPMTTHIIFTEGPRLLEFFRKNDAVQRFHALCRQIGHAGYTSRDVS